MQQPFIIYEAFIQILYPFGWSERTQTSNYWFRFVDERKHYYCEEFRRCGSVAADFRGELNKQGVPEVAILFVEGVR